MADPRMQIIVQAFKELGQFIGKRLENISSQISDIPKYDVSRIEKAIKDKATPVINQPDINVDVNLEEVTSAIKDLQRAIPRFEPIDLSRIEKALLNLLKKDTVTEVNVDLTPLEKQLTAVVKAVSKEKKDVDYTKLLNEIIGALSKKKEDIKIDFPKTFKLDDMQLRTLSASRGGVVGGGDKSATETTIANVSMSLANTEYSYTFPANTLSWTLRLRSTDVPLLYSYTTGKFPTSGDGSAYATVPAYYLQSERNVEWSGKTIYLQTDTASQICEIISYQL